MPTILQTKHDNRTINKIKAILFQNNICFSSYDSERIILVQLYEPREFKLMQALLPSSGNSAIGCAITHKPPFIPKYRPDSTIGAYRIMLQCK